MEPEYIPAFASMGQEGIEYCKKYGGTKPLGHWDQIEIKALEGEPIHFGPNNLSLDEATIIVSEEYKRLVPQHKKRRMEAITLPLGVSIEYGSGPRCLTGVLRRDP